MSEFNPSAGEVTKAVITSYGSNPKTLDITSNFIGKLNIIQSMNEVAWSGSAFIVDTANVLEGFPLRGEEQLELHVKCYDLNTEVKVLARIHRITDIMPSISSNSVTYTIHFISETSFIASVQKIIAPYRMRISGIARTIFNNYMAPIGEANDFMPDDEAKKTLPIQTKAHRINTDESKVSPRALVVQPTDGITKVIIPDLSPTEAMYFLAARGYSPSSPSNTFRFFETLENYYFCTDEYFLKGVEEKDVHQLYYAPVVPLNPENAPAQLGRIEEISVLSKGIDTSTDVYSGSYRNEVVEIDLVRRELNVSKFNFDKDAGYVDMDGKPRDLKANPHTEEFRKDIFRNDNARRFMLFKTYQKPGDNPSNIHANKHIPEIVHNRVSYYHHLNNTALAVTMKGRLDLRPGQLANLDIKTLRGVGDEATLANHALSGRYLIQATNHTLDESGTFQTALRLVKFDWSIGDNPSTSQEIPRGL